MQTIKRILKKYENFPLQVKLAFWLTFSNLVQKGISVLTVPVFTRLMSTVEYGKYSTYLSWLSIATIVCTLRLTGGVYNKGLSKYKDDQNGFCLAIQYTTSIITVLFYLIYLVFHNAVNRLTDMSTVITSLLFLEVFFSTSMGFWSVRQQYSYKYKNVLAGTLTYAVLNPILGVIFVTLAKPELRGTARILSTVLAQVFVGVFFYVINILNGHAQFKKEYGIFAIKFNLPLIPHYFSEYILNQSDRVMIQKLCTYSEVALYSVAYNAGMLLTILTGSINQAITPWLYQSLDEKEFDKIGRMLFSLAIVILLPILIFIALAPEMILVLAGSKYANAVYVIPPVTGSIVFLFFYTSFANVEFYYDYNRFTMYISMIGAAANIVLNYIFIQRFGFVAAGYTTFVCYMIYFLGHYLFVERIIFSKFHRHLIGVPKVVGLTGALIAFMLVMSFSYQNMLLRYSILLGMLVIVFLKRNTIMQTMTILMKKDKGKK